MSSNNNEFERRGSFESKLEVFAQRTSEKYEVLSEKLYKLSYWVGSKLFRVIKKYHTKTSVHAVKAFGKIENRLSCASADISLRKNRIAKKIYAPIHANTEYLRTKTKEAEKAFDEGFFQGILHTLGSTVGFLKLNKSALKTILNYTAPLAALMFFAITLNHVSSREYGLMVEYGGKNIGYIQNESVFIQAEKAARERAVYEEYIDPEENNPTYTLVSVEESMLSTKDMITEQIMSVSGNDLCVASGLYIDDNFVGATTNPDGVIKVLDRMLDYYRTGAEEEEVQFLKPISLKEGLYPKSSVELTATIESTLNSAEKEQQTYTVKEGDVPLEIAETVGMPYSDLKKLNPNIENELFIGQEVLVSRSVPVLGVKVIRKEQYETSIPYETKRIEDDTLEKGETKVKTEGQNGVMEVQERVTYIDGLESDRERLHASVKQEPVTEEILVGTKQPSYNYGSSGSGSGSVSISGGGSQGDGIYTGNFIWPVAGGYVSCGIWGYPGHTGMDIAAPRGTAIYASSGGRVVYSAQSGAYGAHIIIDHGNGVSTLYAHCSALYVVAGDYVSQGQHIAAVGETGNAYGNHLHFEVRMNGRYMDPAAYVGTR